MGGVGVAAECLYRVSAGLEGTGAGREGEGEEAPSGREDDMLAGALRIVLRWLGLARCGVSPVADGCEATHGDLTGRVCRDVEMAERCCGGGRDYLGAMLGGRGSPCHVLNLSATGEAARLWLGMQADDA